MFCFYLAPQACRKACYFLAWCWGSARHPPSSTRSPQLSRENCVVKGTQRIYCSVPWGRVWSLSSFFFLSLSSLPIILPCVWGCFPKSFRHLYPGSRLESAAVMGMVRHFGHGILKVWVSGFLAFLAILAHFLCRCILFCHIWNFFYTLLNPITWFCA